MNNRQALDHIEAQLKLVLPNVRYYYKTDKKGRYLVVHKSGIIGIGIWYNSGKLALESLIPSQWINKRFGRASRIFHLFKRKQRQEFADAIVLVIKRVTK